MNRRFALGRGMWAMTAVVFTFFALVVTVAVIDLVTNPDRGVDGFELVWVLGVSGAMLWVLLAAPRRVEAGPDGLRFVAPGRTVIVPWADLASVSSPRFDLNKLSLRWRFGKRRVSTWGPYDGDLDELLTIVRREAPSADVTRAVTRRPTWGWPRRRRY